MIRFRMVWLAVCTAFAVISGCGETTNDNAGPIEGFVCGTDGKTYSVEEAATDALEVEHRGRCEEPMRCDSEADCFVGDACAQWCVPGPVHCDCPGVFEPVCGEDGRNYINACETGCARVGVRHRGYCEEPPGRGCVRAGCSGQLCVEEGMDIVSTCEWRPVYACYQQATCERQQNGQCGFTPTHELVECLAETQPGGCHQDSDCPPGHYCERFVPEPPDMSDPSVPEPPPGVCVDLCALIDCLPGYVCEAGQCIPVGDCAIETHIRNFEGECVPKCYGPEQCGDEQHCNAAEVCRQDPACPACDVCVGWCEPPAADCRTNGCEPGWTCDYCQTSNGGPEWICLSPEAGACLPPDECRPTGCNGEICADQDVASPCVALPEFTCYEDFGECKRQPWGQCGWTPSPELDQCLSQFDCRGTGCGDGMYCGYCWTSWECLPEGAVC